MALGECWKQLSWFYYQYLLVTALYMLEPWERTVFNSLLISVAGMVLYTGYVFMPQHIMAILHYFEVIQWQWLHLFTSWSCMSLASCPSTYLLPLRPPVCCLLGFCNRGSLLSKTDPLSVVKPLRVEPDEVIPRDCFSATEIFLDCGRCWACRQSLEKECARFCFTFSVLFFLWLKHTLLFCNCVCVCVRVQWPSCFVNCINTLKPMLS